MLTSAVAEICSLGAVIPFLAAITDPNKIARFPFAEDILKAVGLTSSSDILLALTLVFCIAAIVAGAIRMLLVWAINTFAYRVSHDFGVNAYERLMYKPYSWHVSRNTSEAVATIEKVQDVTNGVLIPLMQAASSTLIGLFIISALIAVNPTISLVALVGFTLIYLAVSLFTRKTLYSKGFIIARMWPARLQSIQEGLGGIRDVLLDGSQAVFIKRFGVVDNEIRKAQAKGAFIGSAPRFAIEAAGMVLIALLAYSLAVSQGGLVAFLPVLGVLALGSQRLLPLAQQIYHSWTQLAIKKQSLADVLQLLEAPVSVSSGASRNEYIPFEHEIAFRDVSFRYGVEQNPVLKHLNFGIQKGDRVGIIGKTGSGKSTVVDLLMGLLEPSDGAIEIDGQRLLDMNCRAWQRQIAHVPQSVFLADSSIANNIAFGIDPTEVDLVRVRNAAREAQLASFIETLPQGYDTEVGERGIRLSGGQRQRIGIARALYRRARVLVFDEATNALDTETEAAVMEAIKTLGPELTIILIAHRLSTVSFCNQVLRIEDGCLKENGSYADVVAHDSKSAKHYA